MHTSPQIYYLLSIIYVLGKEGEGQGSIWFLPYKFIGVEWLGQGKV